ncbi:MAG: DUF3060 domain-containing protein [Acidisphaera sp.]|nr:DUF3060 domain-containing protein [Acidisphaera sp.]
MRSYAGPATLVAAAAIALWAASAQAQDADIRADGLRQTLGCEGQDASVHGNGDRVRFAGACRSLDLRGDGDRVELGIVPGGRILVQGNGDHVIYHVAGAGQPSVAVNGEGSDVRAGAPQDAAAPPPDGRAVELTGDSQRRDVDCTDRDVTIEASSSTFTLRGGCRSVTLSGSSDGVEAEMLPGGRIRVTGDSNTLTWFLRHSGADPQIDLESGSSQVRRIQRLGGAAIGQGIAAPEGPGPMLLTGEARTAEASCAGQDVQVQGNGNDFVLRGGCRSLSVHGNGNHIQAELQPGVRVAIQGNGDQVTFVLVASGPEPIVSLDGNGSRAWRVARLGDAGPPPTVGPNGVAVQGNARITGMPNVPQRDTGTQ